MSFIDTRLKIRRFFKKYKKIIIFIVIIMGNNFCSKLYIEKYAKRRNSRNNI